MPETEFSEDEFECNLLFELRDHYGPGLPHFKPSRMLEANVGYDFAVETQYRGLAGSGVYLDNPLLSTLVPPQRRALVPHRYATTLIQCKVPFYVTRRHGKNAKVYNAWGCPYFRLEVDDGGQHGTLIHTEQQLAGIGIVRYASPCFHEHTSMEAYCVTRLIVQRSHFVSPARIGAHGEYTYIGPLGRGIAWSKPEDVAVTPPLKDIRETLSRSKRLPFAVYVAQVFQSVYSLMLDSGYAIGGRELEGARLVLGNYADLPLDPLGFLDEDTLRIFGEFSPSHEAQLQSYAAVVLGLERFFRRSQHVSWQVFWDDDENLTDLASRRWLTPFR